MALSRMGAGPLYAALDRHRNRRSQGVPTLGVIEGPTPNSLAPTLHAWAQARHVTCVDLTALAPSADELPGAWLRGASRSTELDAVAARWLSTKLRREPGSFSPRTFASKTPYERDALRRGLESEHGSTVGVCFRLLDASSPDNEAWSWGDVAALHDLLGPAEELFLLLSAWADGAERLPATLTRLARLAEAKPRCAALLLCPAGWLDRRIPPASRLAALLAEGRVPVPANATFALDVDAPVEAPAEARREVYNGSPAVESYEPPPRAEASKPPVDEARSAAERFLYTRLNEYAPTRGLFELNARIAMPGEAKWLEIDLLCRGFKLAIELDGYYHFADPEAYRRDRRKDVALQCAGYVVLRFLSDDVVSRLEPILDTVARAIEWRRTRKESAPWARTPSRRSPRSR